MRLSLRLRVLLLLAAVNAVMFTAGGMYMRDRLHAANDEMLRYLVEDVLSTALPSSFDALGDLRVRTILLYDSWSKVDDAVVIGRKNLTVQEDGRVVLGGIDINPVGSAHRPPDFDRQEILAAIVRAMETRRPVEVARGWALPVMVDRQSYGGCWFRYEGPAVFANLFKNLLPLFLLSTLFFTAGTYWMLGRLVVGPVELLAGGARRVQTGDLSVRLSESSRRDELADLVRSFNLMTATVQGFNARLEEEVRRATDLARRAEAAAMTQRRLAAMGELAAGIAHEINNPLGGMINAVEALGRDDISKDRRRQYRALVGRGLARIGDTVHRLRRFTPRDAPHEQVDLAAVVQDSIDLVRHRARLLGIAIGWAPVRERGAAVVQGAPNELGQAVLNLLSNSLDALKEGGTRDPTGGRIDVELTVDGASVRLRVRDNGPGVSPEELTRVPDLFYTTKEVGKGTGLGLALVHSTVREHRGQIALTSEPGEFFCVDIRIPAAGPGPEEGT